MKQRVKLTALFAFCLLCFALDIVWGSVRIPIAEIFSGNELYRHIILNFRLPKAITAILTGAAISVAGLVMQTFFQNQLAGPYVLGVSSGAGLGVALFLMGTSILPQALTASGWGLVISAVLGAFLLLMIVITASAKVRNAASLLIVGLMFGQIAGSIVTILQNSANADSLKLFIVWTFGSLSAVSWKYMTVMMPIVLIGLALTFVFHKNLNALLLGENYAQSLGINIKSTRILIIVIISLLAGATTAFTGPIAFIGIAVPHLVRSLLQTSNHRYTIVGCIVVGAIIMLLCDVATQLPGDGRTLPINAVSALIGAPVIIWIILKERQL